MRSVRRTPGVLWWSRSWPRYAPTASTATAWTCERTPPCTPGRSTISPQRSAWASWTARPSVGSSPAGVRCTPSTSSWRSRRMRRCGYFGPCGRSKTRSGRPRPRPTSSRAPGPPTTCYACCCWRVREGSPVARALAALPPGTVHGGIKITEQGEIVSQNFGLLSIAERSLELMLSGVLVHRFEDWRDALEPGEEARFREIMDRLAAEALPRYRALVYGSGELFRLFLDTTPIRELADVRFGSRPAYRALGEETMEGIRAIPWVFGWTQTRLMLPGWLGVGPALEAVASEAGGLAVLRRMAHAWPFFDDLLAKVEMVCAKADMAIARMYVRELGGDLTLFDHLEDEFRQTIAALLRVRESDYLMRDNPMLQTAIGLRNPYVDPLSLLQVTLLRRKRDGTPGDPAAAAVRASGYTDVELLWSFGNFGRTTEQVRAALDKEGLRAPSAHCSPTILFVGWDRSLAIAHRLGHEYLIVPSFTPDTARSLDDWRE